jgi:predicted RNA-binding protein with RPS1 domain
MRDEESKVTVKVISIDKAFGQNLSVPYYREKAKDWKSNKMKSY